MVFFKQQHFKQCLFKQQNFKQSCDSVVQMRFIYTLLFNIPEITLPLQNLYLKCDTTMMIPLI